MLGLGDEDVSAAPALCATCAHAQRRPLQAHDDNYSREMLLISQIDRKESREAWLPGSQCLPSTPRLWLLPNHFTGARKRDGRRASLLPSLPIRAHVHPLPHRLEDTPCLRVDSGEKPVKHNVNF